MSEAMRSNEKPSKMKRSAMAVVMAGGLAVSACSSNGEGGALGGGFGASEDEMSVFGNACANHEERNSPYILDVHDEMYMNLENVANGNIDQDGYIRQDIIDAFVEDPNGLTGLPDDVTVSKEQRATIGEKMQEMNSNLDLSQLDLGYPDDGYQYYLDKEDTQSYVDMDYLKENNYPAVSVFSYGDKDDATLCVSYNPEVNDILDQQMAARN